MNIFKKFYTLFTLPPEDDDPYFYKYRTGPFKQTGITQEDLIEWEKALAKIDNN